MQNVSVCVFTCVSDHKAPMWIRQWTVEMWCLRGETSTFLLFDGIKIKRGLTAIKSWERGKNRTESFRMEMPKNAQLPWLAIILSYYDDLFLLCKSSTQTFTIMISFLENYFDAVKRSYPLSLVTFINNFYSAPIIIITFTISNFFKTAPTMQLWYILWEPL